MIKTRETVLHVHLCTTQDGRVLHTVKVCFYTGTRANEGIGNPRGTDHGYFQGREKALPVTRSYKPGCGVLVGLPSEKPLHSVHCMEVHLAVCHCLGVCYTCSYQLKGLTHLKSEHSSSKDNNDDKTLSVSNRGRKERKEPGERGEKH